MRAAVIGSRGLGVADLGNYLPSGVTEIVSGGAKGVDTSTQLKRNITIIEYADIVIAFWDGKSDGTKFIIDNF